MLDQGDLGEVVADSGLVNRLIDAAHRHVKSAELLADDDPDLAYAAVYDAIRKAMTAMLQIPGLRATTAGGHLAVQRAVRAQFGASMGALLRPVDRIRTTAACDRVPIGLHPLATGRGQRLHVDRQVVRARAFRPDGRGP
jgi:hypothetical protein